MLYFTIQNRVEDRTGKSPKRRVRDDDFIVGLSSDYRRISSDYPRIVLSIGESTSGSFR